MREVPAQGSRETNTLDEVGSVVDGMINRRTSRASNINLSGINTDGLRLQGSGYIGSGVKLGRITETSRVGKSSGGSGMVVGMRDNIEEITPKSPTGRTDYGKQLSPVDQMVNQTLIVTQQSNSLQVDQVEGDDLFHRMGLKRSVNEESISRAQRLIKRIRRQMAPRGTGRRGGYRTQKAVTRGVTIDKDKDSGASVEDNLLEVPVQEENIWPHLEEIVEDESTKWKLRLVSKYGGIGCWPETAASP